MADTLSPFSNVGHLDPYVSTHCQRRRLAALGGVFAAVYLVSVVAAGPTDAGRILDSSLMAAAAALSSVLVARTLSRANEAVRVPWSAFLAGTGLYSMVFVLQAVRFAGCDTCRIAAAVVGAAAWLSFSVVLWGALRLAYRDADVRLWTIEVLDASVVLIAASTWLGLLIESKGVMIPRPAASIEFVELLGVPLLAVGTVFTLRSISPGLGQYKAVQALFLTAAASWIVARSANAPGRLVESWLAFAAARAVVVFSAILIPTYAVARGVTLEILNVRGPEDRPVTDVSLAVGALAAAVVATRVFAGPDSFLFGVSLPVLAFVCLLLVVRLALTSEYHRHLEEMVTESSSRFRDLVEGAHQGILEVEADGSVGYCNEASAFIVGLPRSQLLGRDLSDVVEAVDIEAELDDESDSSASSGERHVGLVPRLLGGSRVVGQVTRSDGLSCYVELAPSGGAGKPLRVLLRDVTAEVEGRLRVRRLIKELRGKDAERSALMRDMLETAESERYSIASQLHDGPVQHLTLLALKLDLLRKRAAQGLYEKVISESRRIGTEMKSEARHLSELSNSLSPVVRPDADLATAMEGMMRSIFEHGTDLGPTRWRVVVPEQISLSPTAKISLYRCIQAIALDARVSGARRAEIELDSHDGTVTARVVTDAPLDSARARGVARAKVWAARLGGSFAQRRKGGIYEAELRIPSTPEEPS